MSRLKARLDEYGKSSYLNEHVTFRGKLILLFSSRLNINIRVEDKAEIFVCMYVYLYILKCLVKTFLINEKSHKNV